VKRRSPSKGDLNPNLDPAEMARAYERGGARALSVLTEPDFFGGSTEDFVAAREATMLPVLWKDFVLDRAQVVEACAKGADAVLLIVRILGDDLPDLILESKRWGLCALVEVFDERDVERALDADADVIGVNHRDLQTFEEDPTATKRLRPLIPDGVVLVAASAISSRADIEALDAIGVDAALVAEAVVTAPDPEAKVRELAGS
jgi:indole-3-glycerol phosphate synthase